MSENLVTVGRVGAPHGIRGELKLQLFLENPEQVHSFKGWHLQYPGKSHFLPFTQFKFSEKGGQYYIAFTEVTDRDQARQFTHALLAVPREELPILEPGEFYWSDLEGLSVYDTANRLLGVVDHLLATGANDVLVVKKANSGQELLIPYVYPEIVRNVDLAAGTMQVDWEE